MQLREWSHHDPREGETSCSNGSGVKPGVWKRGIPKMVILIGKNMVDEVLFTLWRAQSFGRIYLVYISPLVLTFMRSWDLWFFEGCIGYQSQMHYFVQPTRRRVVSKSVECCDFCWISGPLAQLNSWRWRWREREKRERWSTLVGLSGVCPRLKVSRLTYPTPTNLDGVEEHGHKTMKQMCSLEPPGHQLPSWALALALSICIL